MQPALLANKIPLSAYNIKDKERCHTVTKLLFLFKNSRKKNETSEK